MIAIAIDGPSGAGKSTIARKAASELSFIYIDTGALYRAVALSAIRENVAADNLERIKELLDKTDISLNFNKEGEQRVYLNSEDVSDLIRTPEVSMAASAISAVNEVRAFLLDLQRDMAKKNNVIMDGRDIGTVVLPDAQIKIFLYASPEDRAKRRFDELCEKGMDVKYDDVLEDIKTRDYNDSNRDIAPLKPADDAIMIDTTGNELETSISLLVSLMKEHMPK